jgi:thiol-disulfide isomerase/thioredoxin
MNSPSSFEEEGIILIDGNNPESLAQLESKNKIHVVLYFRDSCPHCRQFKPEYMQVQRKVNGFPKKMRDQIQLYAVDLEPSGLDVNTKQKNQAMANRYNIRGVPSVLIFGRNENPYLWEPHTQGLPRNAKTLLAEINSTIFNQKPQTMIKNQGKEEEEDETDEEDYDEE